MSTSSTAPCWVRFYASTEGRKQGVACRKMVKDCGTCADGDDEQLFSKQELAAVYRTWKREGGHAQC